MNLTQVVPGRSLKPYLRRGSALPKVVFFRIPTCYDQKLLAKFQDLSERYSSSRFLEFIIVDCSGRESAYASTYNIGDELFPVVLIFKDLREIRRLEKKNPVELERMVTSIPRVA